MADEWELREMKYRNLKISCNCGGEALTGFDVAVTNDYSILLVATCPDCSRKIGGKVSYEEAMQMSAKLAGIPGGLTDEDREFLHEFHIKEGD